MDTPFIKTLNENSVLEIAPGIARQKPMHIKAATMPRASLNQ